MDGREGVPGLLQRGKVIVGFGDQGCYQGFDRTNVTVESGDGLR